MNSTILLKAQRVSKAFQGFLAVMDADFEISPGEIVGIIGPNGAGKSTFFNCLSGEMIPTSGSVIFQDMNVTRATPEQHALLGIGRTYQVPATFEDMTILDNVMVGAFLRHAHQADARKEAMEVLDFTGLRAQAGHRAKSLGTPGRKRLEIARALATKPRLLLLDEALSGLTPLEIQQAIGLVRRIHRAGVTLVIVEHIMEVVLTLAQRIIVFNHGQIIATGKPEEIVNDPKVVNAYLGSGRKSRRLSAMSGPTGSGA